MILVVLAVCAAVVAVLWAPLRAAAPAPGRSEASGATVSPFSERAGARAEELGEEKDRVFQALADLRFDYESGKLSPSDFEAEDARLRARAADLLHALEGERSAPAAEDRV